MLLVSAAPYLYGMIKALKMQPFGSGPAVKLAFVSNNIPGEQIGIPLFKALCTSLKGCTNVYDDSSSPATTTDYSPYARAIVSSGANVVIVDMPGSLIISALRQAGYKGAINTQPPLDASGAVLPAAAATYEGTYIYSDFPTPQEASPAIKHELKALKAIGSNLFPNQTISSGYWGADFLFAAIRRSVRTSRPGTW